MSETYIPSARDSIVGYFGTTSWGAYRSYCVCCNDKTPLGNPAKIYGDLYVASGPHSTVEHDDTCDVCGVTFLALSQSCQQEHVDQQAHFARLPVLALVEYGTPYAIRCRVY